MPSMKQENTRITALTPRLAEICQLVAEEGLTDKEIGGLRHLGTRTVGRHIVQARRKLGARNRAHLAAKWTLQAPA